MAKARQVAVDFGYSMREILKDGNLLALPVLPGPPPDRAATPEQLADFERRTLQLASIATLAGLPQVRAASCSIRFPLHFQIHNKEVGLLYACLQRPCTSPLSCQYGFVCMITCRAHQKSTLLQRLGLVCTVEQWICWQQPGGIPESGAACMQAELLSVCG